MRRRRHRALTPEEEAQYARIDEARKRWEARLKPQLDALEESGRITAKDLQITILPVRE